uniref:Polycystin-1 n=1 Tax=Globodera pallida TaxID=36090 RepID=A0A183CE68_GLOPA
MLKKFGCVNSDKRFYNQIDEFLVVYPIRHFNDEYYETCQHNSQCPDFMSCNKAKMCTCNIGLSFSHSLSKCERSKEVFVDFTVEGPYSVDLSVGWVEFKAVVRDVWKGVNWTFSWIVIDGMDNARFAGMDGPSLNLTKLKAGFVRLTLSVSNATSEGHMSHNLTITDESKYSVRIVECERRANAEFIRLWLPLDKKLKLSGDSAEIVSNKWVRIDHTLNPVDISVAFLGGRSSNATVKIFVQDRPKVPVINIRNETVRLPADSVMLKAQILNNSVDVFVNFTWEQIEGPFQVELANRHLLSPSIVGQIGIPGLYVFRVRGITIAEDIADAQLFLNVLPEKNVRLRPVVLGDNVSVFFPLKYVVLEPMLWRNIDTFTWEPGNDVPAVMVRIFR